MKNTNGLDRMERFFEDSEESKVDKKETEKSNLDWMSRFFEDSKTDKKRGMIMKKNIKLTEAEYEKLKAEFENADAIIEEAAELKEKHNIETVSDFVFVLKIAKEREYEKRNSEFSNADEMRDMYPHFIFPNNFFKDMEIISMQNLPGNAGYEYLVILLKLYCCSTKQGGFIKIRTATTGGIDYDVIADIIRHKDVNTVKAAITYFLGVGLLEVTEDVDYTTFLVPAVKNSI